LIIALYSWVWYYKLWSGNKTSSMEAIWTRRTLPLSTTDSFENHDVAFCGFL